MKPWMVALLLLIVGAGGAGGGYWFARHGVSEKSEEPGEGAKTDEPTIAKVSVAPIRRGTISEQIQAYGMVMAPAGEVRPVSVPFESRVLKILVTQGQPVPKDQPLIEVAGSAATALQFEEAKAAQAAAERDFNSVKSKYDRNLVTNTELYAAENALQTAKGRLASLEQVGADKPRELRAENAGVVSKIDSQVGQVVPAGGPLVEVAAANKIEVKLGVDPRQIPHLKEGQAVEIRHADDDAAAPVSGVIRLISKGIDPVTRFVDVIVSLPENESLVLDGFVVGKLSVKDVPDALIVPRSAVLPGDDGDFEVFTIADGKAVPHSVHVGVETEDQSQIIADDLKEGDTVVITGNNELEKGMKVTVEQAAKEPEAATEPAATQPAATQPVATQPAASVRRKSNVAVTVSHQPNLRSAL